MKNCLYRIVFSFLTLVLFFSSVEAQISAVVTVQNATCNNSNGAALVTPSGGSGYTYQWSAGGSITNTASGLAVGNYTVTVYSTPVSDSIVKPFSIVSPTAITASLLSDSMPRCGKKNGAIYCATTDSHAVNTFMWNGVIVEVGGGTQYLNADTGTYTFYAVDSTTGCSDTIYNIVLVDTSSYPVFSNVVVTPEQCFGNKKGAIYVTVGNCATGCSYSWSQNAADHTDSAVSLPAGIDTFFVTKGGCVNIDTIITVPGPPAALTSTLRTHPDHCSHDIGSAVAVVNGGTGPFTYTWSMGTAQPLDSVSQLVGDSTVMVTVTDSHGCTTYDTAYITSTAGPRATMNKPDTICSAESNGILIVTPTTNDGPFTYLWSNGQTTNVNAGISAGAYAVTVMDAVGCDTVLLDTVPAYMPVLSNQFIPSATVSPGQTVEVNILTNVPLSDVRWSPYIPGSNGNTSVAFKPEQTTTYSVVLTFGQGCTLLDTFQVGIVIDSTSKWSIPNTFTPNGDGLNDNFKLITYPEVSTFHIWIFDRWGNKVYESTDVNFYWNGLDQFAGNNFLNTGVFAYVIQYETYNGNGKNTIGGNISLVR